MAASEVRAGRAYVEVYTKDSTSTGLSAVKAKLGSFAASVAKVGGIAVSAAAAGISAAVMKTIGTGAGIQDIADRYQIGTTAVQQLSYAAQQSGADLNTLIVGIRNMQKGLGGGLLADELKQIGLSAADLQGMAPEKQFAIIAEAIGGIYDPAQKTALAMKIFGKSGADLIPLLKAGEGGVKSLTEEFDSLGITMSEEAVREAAQLDDQLQKLGAQFNALIVAIGIKFLPLLKETTDFLSRAMKPPKAEAERGPGYFTEDGRFVAQARFNLMPKPIVGTGQSAMADFLRNLTARLKVADETATRVRVDAGLNAVRDALRENGVRSRDMAWRNVSAIPGNALLGLYGYLSGEKMKQDMATFGTFDSRDVAGGGYLQATQQQLAELKAIKQQLEAINRKKPGVPWG